MTYKAQVAKLADWAMKRHDIWKAREAGKPKPWTTDLILQNYRFCNVYRELDRETIWIRQHVREPHAMYPYLWWLLMLCRRINWSPTLREIILMNRVPPYSDDYHPKLLMAALDSIKRSGTKIHSAAYMISAKKGDTNKNKTTAYACLLPPWKRRDAITQQIREACTLQATFDAIQESGGFGWGGFMAAQVVADLKHTPVLLKAPDRDTWAASGPGSRRGLNRVMERDKDDPWKEDEWHARLMQLRADIEPYFRSIDMPMVDAQDLQNCLCEFDKYERARTGVGRPKAGYPGKA